MEKNGSYCYYKSMIAKSLSAYAGEFLPAASPWLLAFWAALLAFALALRAYRTRSPVYLPAALFFAAMASSQLGVFSPGLGDAMAAAARALPVAMLGASRAALAYAADKACDGLTRRAWRIASYAAAGLVIAAAAAAALLGPSSASAFQAGIAAALAAHAALTVPFIAAAAKTSPAAVRLLGGAVPWAIAWLSAAALAVARAAGLDLGGSLDGYAPVALAAADGLVGAALMLAAMMELAKPAPEDTALDEYAARVDASIKRFIPMEFLEHLEKTDFFDLRLGDHVRKDMTIFFSDIRAFTELSEQLTPEESFAFINSYLSRVVPIIDEHEGFIDKYMGDGIMALFAMNGGADQAVECAVEMQVKMVEYNGHRAKMSYRPISMGIGIHTGPLMLGVVGVSDRMEGTVISDAVNLSSRLQSIAKAFNIPLVISERTFMQLDDPGRYKYRFIGKVRVKGKDAPVSVFEIFDGLPEELFERKMKSNTFFEQGMMAYYQKDYSQGVFYFKRALESVPDDGASRFYLETCLRKAMSPKSAEI